MTRSSWPSSAAPDVPPRQPARILIIDDDTDTCRILSLIFRREGYEVVTAETGQVALEQATMTELHLALLDLQLPDTTGVDLLTPLQKLQPDIAVIVFTGHASVESAIQALNSGASAYITKPIKMDEVLAKVADVLEKQQLVRDKRDAEETLRRRNRELALFNRVVTAATSTLDGDQVLQEACDGLAQAFDLHRVDAVLLNGDGTIGTIVAEHLLEGQTAWLGNQIRIAELPLLRHLAAHPTPILIKEPQGDERLEAAHDLLAEIDTSALLLVPIPVARGRVAGAFALHTCTQRAFSEDEITLALNVAAAAGQALETARLYQALRRNVEKLEETVAQRTAELEVALARAQDADRVKSEFVSNVSHELRTPLASIKLFLGLLDRGQPEKHPVYLDTLRRETDRLQNLIETLLDISRLDLGKTEAQVRPTDLNHLVETLAADREALAADRGLSLDVALTEPLPLVQADPKLIEQVLTNLLTNAVNYTPAGGKVCLCTGTDNRDGGPGVTISVSDTGPGIPEQERPHLFERFYRGSAGQSSKAPGTGLGLAICKEIMMLHKGHIMLQSGAANSGATFTIWLPGVQ
jgi:signal transduction histidine kinase/FixJ family two-component response regulator